MGWSCSSFSTRGHVLQTFSPNQVKWGTSHPHCLFVLVNGGFVLASYLRSKSSLVRTNFLRCPTVKAAGHRRNRLLGTWNTITGTVFTKVPQSPKQNVHNFGQNFRRPDFFWCRLRECKYLGQKSAHDVWTISISFEAFRTPCRHLFWTSTLSQLKGRAPQPSITFSCQARGVVVVVGGGVPVVGGGGPPRRHVHDSIRQIPLTAALGPKSKLPLGNDPAFVSDARRVLRDN